MIQLWWNQHGLKTLWLLTLGVAAVLAVQAALIWTSDDDTAERVEKVEKRLTIVAAPAAAQDAPPSDSGDRWRGRRGSPDADTSSDPLAQAVARVRERHLFMPAPPEAFRNVQGILGDRVLYGGGQSYRLGDQAMGATITAIGSNWVEFVKNDEKITIDIFRGGTRGPERARWDGMPNAASLPEAAPSNDNGGRRFEGRGNRSRSDNGGYGSREDRPRRGRGGPRSPS